MSQPIRKIVAMLKMHKRLRKMLSTSTSRVASANLRRKLAKLGGALELEMDRLARAQFLEGMFLGPGKQNRYPSRRLPHPKMALELAAGMMESEGATPEAIEMWTTPKNTKFFVKSWRSVEPVLEGYNISTEDVAAWMVSGMTPSGAEGSSAKEGFSARLFERVGQDHFKGKVKIKTGVLSGELTPRQVAKYTQKRVYHKALNVKDQLDRELDQTDYMESNRVRNEDDALLSDTIGGGDVFDTHMTRDDAMLDLMTEGHEGATGVMEGLLRSVSSDRDRDILRMIMDVAARGTDVGSSADIDDIVAERYRAETGEPISPRQVSNIRRKQMSKAMKPAYDGARVLADAIDEAGGSSSSLREIMIDNLMDTDDIGPRLYPILPRAYSGGPRNKWWAALKQVLSDGEFLVTYDDLLTRMVEVADPTSEALISGVGGIGSLKDDADEFVKSLAEDLIALLAPIAEGMGLVDDEIFLRNELEMGRIRQAAQRIATAYLKKK